MKSMLKVGALAAVAALALSPGEGRAEVRYWVTELRPPGAVSSYMQDLNEAGQVNGWFADAAGNQFVFVYANGAFNVVGSGASTYPGIGTAGETIYWDGASQTWQLWAGGKATNLTALGIGPNHVNGAGLVVGGSTDGFPVKYQNGVVSEYTLIQGSGAWVSSAGHMVGYDVAGGTFLASPAGLLTTLPFTYFASMDHRHSGVNASGVVAGTYVGSQGESRLGYYDTSLHDLGAEFPGMPGTSFDPRGINARGDIHGNVSEPGIGSYWTQDAFFFTKGSARFAKLRGLGGLQACAHGGDDAGNVVGHSNVPGQGSDVPGPHTLWSGGKVYDLNTLVPAGTPYLADYGGQMNNKGQILVNGTDRAGATVALLLTPLPLTKATLSGTKRAADGWYTTNVTVALSATDAVTGVKELHYRVDGGAEKVVAAASASFSISTGGAHAVTFWAVDKAGHAESPRTQLLAIDKGGLGVTTPAQVAATAGAPFSLALAAKGGTAPYTFAVTGALPDGLAASGATVSGTPTAAGDVAVTVTVTDAKKATATSRITFAVASRLVVTTPALVSASKLVGLTAAGAVGTPSWAVTSALPAGLVLHDATLVPDGTAALGEYPVTVTATDEAGRTATRTLTVGVYDPIVVDGPVAAVVVAAGDAVAVPFSATGGRPGGYTWALATDVQTPPGLSIDPATGTVSGAVATAGSYNVGVVATDGAGGSGSYYVWLVVQ